MPGYQVHINGQNFLINSDGNISRHGFFTYRFVEAPDPKSAENAAVQMIRDTQRLRDVVLNAPNDPPVMDVTEILEIELNGESEIDQPGFVFYAETPKRWWQFWKSFALIRVICWHK